MTGISFAGEPGHDSYVNVIAQFSKWPRNSVPNGPTVKLDSLRNNTDVVVPRTPDPVEKLIRYDRLKNRNSSSLGWTWVILTWNACDRAVCPESERSRLTTSRSPDSIDRRNSRMLLSSRDARQITTADANVIDMSVAMLNRMRGIQVK